MSRKNKRISALLLFLVIGTTAWMAIQHNTTAVSKIVNRIEGKLELHPSSMTIERKGRLQLVKRQPPAIYHVNDAQLTDKIYQSLLDLQPVSNGVFHCPIDFGISYEMTFYENGKKVFSANVGGGGCRFVQFQGQSFRSTDPFWKLMQEATGMNAQQLWGTPGAF